MWYKSVDMWAMIVFAGGEIAASSVFIRDNTNHLKPLVKSAVESTMRSHALDTSDTANIIMGVAGIGGTVFAGIYFGYIGKKLSEYMKVNRLNASILAKKVGPVTGVCANGTYAYSFRWAHFLQVVAISAMAVGYFAQFMLLGIWMSGMKWAVESIEVVDALDKYKVCRAALWWSLSFKTASAVLGHAWAVTKRSCAERMLEENKILQSNTKAPYK